MSWIIGCYSRRPAPDARRQCERIHDTARHTFATGSLYLACGGHEVTTSGGRTEAGDPWMVVGLGLFWDAGRVTCMDQAAWSRILSSTPPPEHIEGAFAGIVVRHEGVILFTDPLGIRPIYVSRSDGGVIFGSRLDWVARLAQRSNLDMQAFGSHWLLSHQLSTASLVRGVDRLGPGARCAIRDGELSHEEHAWTPAPGLAPDEPENVLDGLLRVSLPVGRRRSLELNGGIDSRLLLALVGQESDFELHALGPRRSPDARVARRLGLALQRNVPIVDEDERISADDLWADAIRRSTSTAAVAPASEAAGDGVLAQLDRRGVVSITDAFGGIGRRAFFGTLNPRGRTTVLPPERLMRSLRLHRADCFVPDFARQLEAGARLEAKFVFGETANAGGWTHGELLDLIAIRTRLPNAVGYASAHHDEMLPRVLPFASPTFLRSIFGLPIPLRRDGRMYRRIIRDSHVGLTRPPLIDAGLRVPFSVPAHHAATWRSLRQRVRLLYRDRARRRFLYQCRFHINDLVMSQRVSSAGLYDLRRLSGMVEDYYRGEERLGHDLDWWLSFEFWRNSLHSTDA